MPADVKAATAHAFVDALSTGLLISAAVTLAAAAAAGVLIAGGVPAHEPVAVPEAEAELIAA